MLLLLLQYFLNVSFFSWARKMIVLLNHGGSLSSQIIIWWVIKLVSIFLIVLLKIETFFLTLVLRKALSQLKSVTVLLISSVFACLNWFLVDMVVVNIFVNQILRIQSHGDNLHVEMGEHQIQPPNQAALWK